MSKNSLNIFFLLPGIILLIAPIFLLPFIKRLKDDEVISLELNN